MTGGGGGELSSSRHLFNPIDFGQKLQVIGGIKSCSGCVKVVFSL
jgi:hypothetical protein